MKELIVDVLLWDKLVGSLVWDEQRDVAVFEFAKDYRSYGLELSPLKLSLTGRKTVFSFIENKNSCFKGLPGFIADALPDKFGDQIITEWLLRKLNFAPQSMTELYRRMVFNVMSRNHDDHTKNFSFLMDKEGNWSLAPAYDLCYSYNPGGRWTSRHQMSINSKRDDFTLQDLYVVADKMGIRKYREIIEEVSSAISKWQSIAKECGVRDVFINEIETNLLYSMK